MRDSFAFEERVERLEKAISAAVENFRCGNDHHGLDHFLDSLDDLEMLMEWKQDSGEFEHHLGGIINVLDKLYESMKQKDVIAMTDLLEHKLFPLAKEWHKGRNSE